MYLRLSLDQRVSDSRWGQTPRDITTMLLRCIAVVLYESLSQLTKGKSHTTAATGTTCCCCSTAAPPAAAADAAANAGTDAEDAAALSVLFAAAFIERFAVTAHGSLNCSPASEGAVVAHVVVASWVCCPKVGVIPAPQVTAAASYSNLVLHACSDWRASCMLAFCTVLCILLAVLQRPRKRELLRRRICSPLPPAGGEGRPTWGRKRPLAGQLWFMLLLVC